MNKKYLVSLSLITILSLSTGLIFSEGQKKQSRSENTAILTIDTKNNEYTIEKDEEIEKGSANYSANIDTDNFYNICNFTSIDTDKLTVTSHSNNPGDLHLKAVKSKDNSVHYSTNGLNLKPGESWTTKGNLKGFWTKYTIIGKASVKGNYTFTLKW